IVVVDQTASESLGSVYVIYLGYANQRIYVYRTSDKGASWTADVPYFDLLNNSAVRLAGTTPGIRIRVDPAIGKCVVAASIISARYNWHGASDALYGSIGL